MKVNIFMLFIALILAAMVFIGFNHYYGDLLYTVGTTVVALIMLATGMSFTPEDSPRSGIMIKVASWVFFIILMLVDILFAFYDISGTMFLIVNLAILCGWAVGVYSIARAKQ